MVDEKNLAHFGLCEFCRKQEEEKYFRGKIVHSSYYEMGDMFFGEDGKKGRCRLMANRTSMHIDNEEMVQKWKKFCPYFTEHMMIDTEEEDGDYKNEEYGNEAEWQI